MSFLNRIGLGAARTPATSGAALQAHSPAAVTAMAKPSFSPHETRGSNSLKDFLWHLNGLGRGNLLDMGPVWQSTVTFFIERGFKVSTEDVLTGWKQLSQEEADRQRKLPDDAPRMTRAELAKVFLETSLQFAPGSLDAVLAWDILDYLEDDVMQRVADRLRSIVREGGVILAMFHSKRPQQFQRYRIKDEKTLEMVPSTSIFPMARVFQNREISDLFSKFHTSKTYLGRDQLREGLFVK
jgi:hypothetical protein